MRLQTDDVARGGAKGLTTARDSWDQRSPATRLAKFLLIYVNGGPTGYAAPTFHALQAFSRRMFAQPNGSFYMNNVLKYAALAVFAGGVSTPVLADTASTKGGFQLKSDDGNFEAKLGGRIHLDTNFFLDDDEIGGGEKTNAFFRRARLTLEGKAFGWSYKFEEDFVESGNAGFREMWIGTKLGGANLRLGQAKPYRSLEELTSSNEVLFMERPYSSASGLYDGRQFQIGAFLDGAGSNWGWGVSGHSLRNASGVATDGFGASARGYFAPIMSDSSTLHLGLSYSVDNPDAANAANNVRARARALGRSDTLRPTLGTVGGVDAGSGTDQSTAGVELGFLAGPLFVQAEYAMASFASDTAGDTDVDSGYVQASYVFGSSGKRYDVKKGVFKSPGVKDAGVWEAKFRYDFIKNDASPEAELTQLAAGVNYYINPNVRLMVEYVTADVEPADVSADLLSTRLQFSF